ncbi:MAG: hypothetical protein P4N59_05515 [Negativicutes bacterium]|nr:hypothetical protein [Negativicutes bacterium]
MARIVFPAHANKFAPYQRMANSIIELTCENGEMPLQQDLLAFGYTENETTANWHMASAMAEVEIRMIHKKFLSAFERTGGIKNAQA